MKKNFIILFACFLYLVASAYGEESKVLKLDFISSEPISIELSNEESLDVLFSEDIENNKIDYKIVDKPVDSKIKVEIIKNGEKFHFTKIGSYNILFIKKPYFQKNVKIDVKSNYQFTEKEIYDIIQGGYVSKNLQLVEKYVGILKDSYPNSLYMKRSFYGLFELYSESGDYNKAISTGEEILRRYKLNSYEKEEFMLKFADFYEKVGDLDKYFEIYRELSLKSSYYADTLAKKYIDSNMDSSEAIKFLEKRYGETLDKNIAQYLARYYYENDIDKAVPYYKWLKNTEKLAEIYIKSEKFEELESLKNGMDNETLEKVELFKTQYEIGKKSKEYFRIAGENLKAGKYGIAEMYYEKILDTSEDDSLIKDASYKLIELNYTRGENEKALEALAAYAEKYKSDDELGVLNYFALLNYKLGNYAESKIYFDRILEKYPKTTWARRAKIYSIRIEKIKN